MDWTSELLDAAARVESWIAGMTPDAWAEPNGRAWTNKDLLGHLASWSELLLDQVEALERGCPGRVAAVDVDGWNAAEVARHRGGTAGEAIDRWRRSVTRALRVVGRLSPESLAARWPVAWQAAPASVEDVLRLWVGHVGQHSAGAGWSRVAATRPGEKV